jgi:hypothetical protein
VLKQVTGDTHGNAQVMVKRTRTIATTIKRTRNLKQGLGELVFKWN